MAAEARSPSAGWRTHRLAGSDSCQRTGTACSNRLLATSPQPRLPASLPTTPTWHSLLRNGRIRLFLSRHLLVGEEDQIAHLKGSVRPRHIREGAPQRVL